MDKKGTQNLDAPVLISDVQRVIILDVGVLSSHLMLQRVSTPFMIEITIETIPQCRAKYRRRQTLMDRPRSCHGAEEPSNASSNVWDKASHKDQDIDRQIAVI